MSGMKNISKAEVMVLKDQVDLSGGTGSQQDTGTESEHVSVTLFSFDKGEEISTHESGGDAFVTCLDGVGKDDDRRCRVHSARGRVHRDAGKASACRVR